MAYIDDVYSVVQIQPTGIEAFVRLSQNENGRRLYFAITGGEIPTGSTATLSGTKPDGVVYSKTGTISGNVVTILEDVQLTAAAGPWPAKLRILNGGNVVATGRIRFVIDKDPVAAGAVPSDSQLEGLVAEAAAYAEAAKDGAYYGSPLTASTVAGMTDKNRVYVYTGSESGYTAGNWYFWNGSAWTSGGVYNSQGIQTDKTLSVTGMAADAKAVGDALKEVQVETDKTLTQADVPADAKVVGDEIADLKADLEQLEPGLSDDAKEALLACFEHLAWVDEHGQNYYNALANALYPAPLSISAVFTPGQNKIYDTDSLDDLKQYLTVTGTYTDGSTREINDYSLSGTLSHGVSIITVSKGDLTTTFNVTVEYMSFEWDYTMGNPQSNGFTQYSSYGTGEMKSNGYLMTANDASDNSYRLYYQWPDFSHEYTKAILEMTFILDKWGSYNTAPYTNGIRIEPGLGKSNNVAMPNPEFVLNTSGLTSWHPTQGNRYNHDVLNAYNFVVGNEYTVKIELTPENCKIYINNELLATETSEYYVDATASAIWGVTRGASIIVKSYKEQRGVS